MVRNRAGQDLLAQNVPLYSAARVISTPDVEIEIHLRPVLKSGGARVKTEVGAGPSLPASNTRNLMEVEKQILDQAFSPSESLGSAEASQPDRFKAAGVGEKPNDRRDLLKKLGRYGAYTAPAMLAILAPMSQAAPPSGTS